MDYAWIKYLHVLSALGFAVVHGASTVVLYAIARERDRGRIQAVLGFSTRTARAMYTTLALVVGTGFWMAFERDFLFEQRWYWLSLILLAVITVLMLVVAKPLVERIRAACEMRPSGVPRVSDDELAQILQSPRRHVVAAIGFLGLAAIVYLMVLKPDLEFGASAAPAVSTTLALTTTSTRPDTSDTTLVLVTTTTAPEDEVLAQGREIFEVTAGGVGCAFCHGPDGGGSAYGPSIRGRSRGDIANALRWATGMTDIRLDEDELDAVARYVGTL